MYRTELIYFSILGIIVVLSPSVPTDILLLLDNLLVRVAMIFALLYLIYLGPTAGILGLMAIAVLYLERNRRKVKVATQKLDLMDVNQPQQATVEEEGQPQTTVPVNEFDKPNETESDFLPHNTCSSGEFEPVAPTMNEKTVLSTIYPLNKMNESGSGSNKLFESMGFGHIKGLETVGDA